MSYIVKRRTRREGELVELFVEVLEPEAGETIYHGQFRAVNDKATFPLLNQVLPVVEPVGRVTSEQYCVRMCAVEKMRDRVRIYVAMLASEIPIGSTIVVGQFEPRANDPGYFESGRHYRVLDPRGHVKRQTYMGDVREY